MNKLGVDQPHLKAEVTEPSTPVVGAVAGFHRHQPRRQLHNRLCQPDLAHPLGHDRSAVCVDAVRLEHVLGQIDMVMSVPPCLTPDYQGFREGGIHSINVGSGSVGRPQHA